MLETFRFLSQAEIGESESYLNFLPTEVVNSLALIVLDIGEYLKFM